MKTHDSVFLAIGAVAVVASAVVIGVAQFNGTTHASGSTPLSASHNVVAASSARAGTQSFKDGTYTAAVDYNVPSGTNSISARVDVKSGKIVSVKTSSSYTDSESQWYINDFESSISSDAAGQSIASYAPSRVGGASLTTWAFDNVIDQIRSHAQA